MRPVCDAIRQVRIGTIDPGNQLNEFVPQLFQ